MIYETTKFVLNYHCFWNGLMRLKRKIQVIKQSIVQFVFPTVQSKAIYRMIIHYAEISSLIWSRKMG